MKTKINFVVLMLVLLAFTAACSSKRVRTQTPAAPVQAQEKNTQTPAVPAVKPAIRQSPVAQPALQEIPFLEPPKPGEVAGNFTEEQKPDQVPVAQAQAGTVAQQRPPVPALSPAVQAPQVRTPQQPPEAQVPGSSQVFLSFQLVGLQAGEKETVTLKQEKAAIAAIISPRQDEPFGSYESRVREFQAQFQKVPKRYSDQVAFVRKVYQDQTGESITTIPDRTPTPREQVMIVTSKEQVNFPGKWSTFGKFRIEPLGDEINPNGTRAEIIAEIKKVLSQVIPQVLRTGYDPAMKAEWIEKLTNCANGKTGDEAGFCEIQEIYGWSRLWEYTSGKFSSAQKVEFIPIPEFRHAKALTFYLTGSGRHVGHALPCGLNPIVPFVITTFSVKVKMPPPPPPPPVKPSILCETLTARFEKDRIKVNVEISNPDKQPYKLLLFLGGAPIPQDQVVAEPDGSYSFPDTINDASEHVVTAELVDANGQILGNPCTDKRAGNTLQKKECLCSEITGPNEIRPGQSAVFTIKRDCNNVRAKGFWALQADPNAPLSTGDTLAIPYGTWADQFQRVFGRPVQAGDEIAIQFVDIDKDGRQAVNPRCIKKITLIPPPPVTVTKPPVTKKKWCKPCVALAVVGVAAAVVAVLVSNNKDKIDSGRNPKNTLLDEKRTTKGKVWRTVKPLAIQALGPLGVFTDPRVQASIKQIFVH